MTKARNGEPRGRELSVALLGCGTVGSQVARILLDDAGTLAARSGARLNLAGIAVRDRHALRDVDIPRGLLTTEAEALVRSADVVVELMGGIEPAHSLMLQALRAGASVVTGNKELLARHGGALVETAELSHAHLGFEAAVAGAIPIIRPLRESLAGDRITSVLGILNGTTNYILDQMDATGAAFSEALADAQRLGYAEADPTQDIEGHDAAAKLALLASLAFHVPVGLGEVHCEGIANVTARDVAAARKAGRVIKLLAVAERAPSPVAMSRSTRGHIPPFREESWPRVGQELATRADERGRALGGGVGARDGAPLLNVRVHPTLLPREHPLAAVRGPFNAVFVDAENAGQLMFYGAGAGGRPTASAVMGDLVSIARRIVAGAKGRGR